MTLVPIRRLLAVFSLAAALSLVVVIADQARGQAAKPEPGCAVVNKDAKGDGDPANLDITNFWLDYSGGKLNAYIQVANLTKDLPADATGINWYVNWTVDGVLTFVQAQIEVPNAEPTFSYGTTADNLRSAAGEVPGAFFEGADGIIKMEIPAEAGGVAGKQFTAVTSDTFTSLGIPGVVSSLGEIDNASGKGYTVAACGAGGGGGGTATPTPGPGGGTPTPAPSSTPAPGGGPGGNQTVVQANKLDVKLSGKLPKAKKVKKSLKVGLSSAKGITGVNAALYKGNPSANKIVAKGKAAKIGAGKGKITVKGSKRIKKGSYTLYLVGKNADGQAADKKVKIKLK